MQMNLKKKLEYIHLIKGPGAAKYVLVPLRRVLIPCLPFEIVSMDVRMNFKHQSVKKKCYKLLLVRFQNSVEWEYGATI